MSEEITTIAAFPSAPVVEKDVISVMFQFPEMIDEAPNLTVDHFHIPAHRILFELIRELYAATQPIELVSFIQTLSDRGILDRAGGPGGVCHVIGHAHVTNYFKRHIEILTEKRSRRMMITAAEEMTRVAYEAGDMQELTEAISAPITAIHDAMASETAPSNSKVLIKNALQRYLDRANGIISPMGISTGIWEIDHALKGLIPGRLWVIGAYPSGGKSLLGIQILTHAAINGTPAVFVTLEMSEAELMDRCLILASRSPALAFTDPKAYAAATGHDGPTEGIRRLIQDAAGKLLQCQLTIRKPSNRSLAAICSCIRRAHRETGAKAAAVDYMQVIKAGGHGNNKEQEISEISHTFQELALELGMHILILSQLNSDGDTKHGKVIEEDADAFLQIVQEMDKKKANFKQHQYVLIAKDRHHSKGGYKLPLILNMESLRFTKGEPGVAQTGFTDVGF